jgi:RNA recognition motif-containing protein
VNLIKFFAIKASQDELRDYFSNFGLVKDARIITDQIGNSRGFGFVTYNNEQDASKVLALKEEELIFKENKLNVNQAYRNHNNNHQNQHHMGGQGGFQQQQQHQGGFQSYGGHQQHFGGNMRYGQ